MLAEEHIVDHLGVDPSLFQRRRTNLLKVVGMSMKDAGILDGATWWPCTAPRRCATGRSLSPRLESEVTVKRYRQQGPSSG